MRNNLNINFYSDKGKVFIALCFFLLINKLFLSNYTYRLSITVIVLLLPNKTSLTIIIRKKIFLGYFPKHII